MFTTKANKIFQDVIEKYHVINTVDQPFGKPKDVHLVSVIGAQQGVDFVNENFNDNTHLWIAAIDAELNERGYIIPGLGDAGDLSYGSKL